MGEYIVERSTRKFNVTTPRRRFRPLGVPPEAKFVAGGVIGAAGVPGESVTIATFEGKFEDIEYFVTVTHPDCFPVSSGDRSKDNMEITRFSDMKTGISDPEVFYPPRDCPQV